MIDGAYAAAGALTGFVVGLTGVGGGALMTPILLLFFGVAPTTAIATDLWFAAITKLVGALIHNGAGQVDWQVVRRLWVGSLPMALLVVVLVSLGHQITKVDWLTKAIGIVVLISAGGLLLAPKLLMLAKGRRLENPAKFKHVQPVLTVLGGAVLGLCVGAMPQNVRRDPLGRQRWAVHAGDTHMLGQQRLNTVSAEPAPVQIGE